MAHSEHHGHLTEELANQLGPIFSGSPQGVYLYLDDTHKICNQKFADMLGYSSVEEWVKNETPVGDIAQIDQPKVIEAYGEASGKYKASAISAAAIKKDGKEIKISIIMVPITYKNEVFVLHFIAKT